jgi:hypothetical protein
VKHNTSRQLRDNGDNGTSTRHGTGDSAPADSGGASHSCSEPSAEAKEEADSEGEGGKGPEESEEAIPARIRQR